MKWSNDMNLSLHKIFCVACGVLCLMTARAQEDAPAAAPRGSVHYSGHTMANVDYTNGQLDPALGVHNYQVFRANREHPVIPGGPGGPGSSGGPDGAGGSGSSGGPDATGGPGSSGGPGWTYNHAPMLAYWNNRFYLEYLSDLVGESVPPGRTLLCTSADGKTWSDPVILFPPYKVPDGTTKPNHPGVAKDLYAVMHQRMGFYTSKSGRLLALAFYGICLDPHDDPNDGEGIGRVVREVYKDGRFGPIYFVHYNPAWDTKNTSYPFYTESKDKGFVDACNELMANPLMMMQWVEETDRKDPLIPLHKDYKAFNYYHLPDGRVVGLWKNALTGISSDGGRTWSPVARAPHFVNSNAKIWGQKTSDGNYATVYNPSEYRWPLAISVSKDGLDYTNLLLVNGDITTMRYGGNYKSYGPQYVRGIDEGNGIPPDGNLWVSYSMNKEDIWAASIRVPVTETAPGDVDEAFAQMPDGKELDLWNIYSPLWAPVHIGTIPASLGAAAAGASATGAADAVGAKCLVLEDHDPFDYARAERLFPPASKVVAEFTVIPAQNDTGMLQIEFVNARGDVAVRLTFDKDSTLKAKAAARSKNILHYEAGQRYDFKVTLNAGTRMYTVNINGKDKLTQLLFQPVESFERVVFRTGEARRFPDSDSPAEQDFDVPHAGDSVGNAAFYITSLKTHGEDDKEK